MTQRIVWYDNQLIYQRLGGDIVTYHEYLGFFDNLVATYRACGQAFEKVPVDPVTVQQWIRDNGHSNDNAGRTAYSEMMHAIHPDIDEASEQIKKREDKNARWRRQRYFDEQYRANNFIGPGEIINWQFAPSSGDPTRRRG